MKEKGTEAIFSYVNESLDNASEVISDEFIELLLEYLKNSSTQIKEKKNIMFLFDNLIVNGEELKVEDELLIITSDLEVEGENMMKKEGISKEEKKEWKELNDASTLLEMRIIKKRKEKEEGEEKKSLLKLIQEKEKTERKNKEMIKNLSSLYVLTAYFSNSAKIKRNGNTIRMESYSGWESCGFDHKIEKVY